MKKESSIPYILPTGYPLNLMGQPESALGQIVTDPMGSYTGVPEELLEKPVQDADDL